jgi:hypothetical protein
VGRDDASDFKLRERMFLPRRRFFYIGTFEDVETNFGAVLIFLT